MSPHTLNPFHAVLRRHDRETAQGVELLGHSVVVLVHPLPASARPMSGPQVLRELLACAVPGVCIFRINGIAKTFKRLNVCSEIIGHVPRAKSLRRRISYQTRLEVLLLLKFFDILMKYNATYKHILDLFEWLLRILC